MHEARYQGSPDLNKCAPRKKPYTCAISGCHPPTSWLLRQASTTHAQKAAPAKHVATPGSSVRHSVIGRLISGHVHVARERANRRVAQAAYRCHRYTVHRHAAKQRHTTHNCADANGPANGHARSIFHTMAARLRELLLAKQNPHHARACDRVPSPR